MFAAGNGLCCGRLKSSGGLKLFLTRAVGSNRFRNSIMEWILQHNTERRLGSRWVIFSGMEGRSVRKSCHNGQLLNR